MTWVPLSLGQARRQQHFPVCFGWGSGWARGTQSEAVWNSRHHLSLCVYDAAKGTAAREWAGGGEAGETVAGILLGPAMAALM